MREKIMHMRLLFQAERPQVMLGVSNLQAVIIPSHLNHHFSEYHWNSLKGIF